MMSKTRVILPSILVLVATALGAGCGSDPEPGIDARAIGGTPDGGAGGTPDGGNAGTPDAAGGAACTGALYDRCNGPTDCLSGICRDYNQGGFSACTQACSAANPCPMQPGAPSQPTCNNQGQCRPAQPNACTL